MTLPINRTALIAAQTNQVPNMVLQSALNIAAIQTPYDTIDELNIKVDANHAAGNTGSTQLADGSVIRQKIAVGAVGAAQLDPTLLTDYGNIAVQAEFDRRGVNVMSRGAKGDGVSDDSLIFKSVFEDASISEIIVPRGIFMINPTNTIFLISNKKITFLEGSVIKVMPNIGNWEIWLSHNPSATSLENITIDGLKFDCNIASNVAGQNVDTGNRQYVLKFLLGSLPTKNITIKNCNIQSCGVNTIMVNGTGAENIVVDNNTIYYKTKSVTAYDNSVFYINTKDHIITRNKIYCTDSTGVGGIETHWGDGLTELNIIKGFQNGINVTAKTFLLADKAKMIVTNNEIDCQNGIILWSSTINLIFKNVIVSKNNINCTNTGVGTYYGTDGLWDGDFENLAVDGNTIYYELGTTLDPANVSTATGGIAIRNKGNVVNCIIKNNTIVNSPYQGISTVRLGGTGTRVNFVIDNNIFINPCADTAYSTITKKCCILFPNTMTGVIENNKIFNPNNNIGYSYAETGGSIVADLIFGKNMIPITMRFQLYSPQVTTDYKNFRNSYNPTYEIAQYAATSASLLGMYEQGDQILVGNMKYTCSARGAIRTDLLATLVKASDGTLTYSNSTNFPIRMLVKIVETGGTSTIFSNDQGVLGISSTITNALATGTYTVAAVAPTWKIAAIGTATILSAGTSVVVAHGMGVAPTNVTPVPKLNLGSMWITAIDATNFTINCSTAAGSNTAVMWEAGV